MADQKAARPGAPNPTLRVDTEFMFSNHKGVHRPRLEKAQKKLLKKIPHIGAFLEDGERILLVTRCISPTPFFEQLTMGLVFYYINRALLVVTDRAVLHVPTKTNYAYRDSVARIRYEDCERIEIRGRSMVVRYRGGKKERYYYIPGAQRRKLKGYFPSVQFGRDSTSNGEKIHLCPRCTRPVQTGAYQCSTCSLPFKDMGTAMRLSIFLPGGGYFYTRHPILGLGDFFVELVLIYFVVIAFFAAAEGQEGGAIILVFFGLILAIEKLLTIYHARRFISEYMPKSRGIKPQPAAGA